MGRKGAGSQWRRHKEREHRLARELSTKVFDGLVTPTFKQPNRYYVPPAYVEFGNLITSVAEARKKPKNRPKHVPLIIAEETYKARRAEYLKNSNRQG